MESEDLFEPSDHLFHGPKAEHMSLYDYFRDSAGEYMASVRQFWNVVFRGCELEHGAKAGIKSRFRKKKYDNHLGALFELFVYELLCRHDYHVRSGPTLSSGKELDFLVQALGKDEFLVEATCVLGDSLPDNEEMSRQHIYDAINLIKSNHFRVALSICGTVGPFQDVGKQKKAIRNEVVRWLNRLDHFAVSSRLGEMSRSDDCHTLRMGVGGSQVVLVPVAMSRPSSSSDYGLVRIGSVSRMKRQITDRFICRKLRDKASQMKGADQPVLLAVNVCKHRVDHECILRALFGEPRGSGGAWLHGGQPRNRSVEAVLFFTNVDAEAMPSQKPVVVLNPFQDKVRIPTDFPFADYYIPSNDGMSLDPFYADPPDTLGDATDWRKSWPFQVF